MKDESNRRKVADLVGGGTLWRCDRARSGPWSYIETDEGQRTFECERCYEDDMLKEYVLHGQLIDPRA